MSNLTVLNDFLNDRSGAVTLDWVALTSTVVVIGMGLVYMVFAGPDGAITTLVDNYNAELGQAATNLSGVTANTPPPLN